MCWINPQNDVFAEGEMIQLKVSRPVISASLEAGLPPSDCTI